MKRLLGSDIGRHCIKTPRPRCLLERAAEYLWNVLLEKEKLMEMGQPA